MKTTNADMQRLYDYMDKMGVTYTVDRNPSPEKIARIKAQIEKNKKNKNVLMLINYNSTRRKTGVEHGTS